MKRTETLTSAYKALQSFMGANDVLKPSTSTRVASRKSKSDRVPSVRKSSRRVNKSRITSAKAVAVTPRAPQARFHKIFRRGAMVFAGCRTGGRSAARFYFDCVLSEVSLIVGSVTVDKYRLINDICQTDTEGTFCCRGGCA